MTVMVLGATGFIGPSVVTAVQARGEEVVAVSRGGKGPGGAACDRKDIATLVELAAVRRVRSVIDLLAYTEPDSLPLLAALGGRIERYVLASSMDVYRNYEGLHGKAAPEPVAGPMDEASPLRTTRYPYRSSPRRAPDAPDAWLDDYDKIPIEAALRTADLTAVILRLPMVFGPRDRQQRFAWILSPMRKGRDRLVVDPGWAAWRTTYGFVDDVADALAHAACRAAAPAGTFNLGEADPPDHRAWIDRFAAVLGWRGEVDFRDAPPGSPIAGLNLAYPLIADSTAFRETYGWGEATSLDETLQRTAAEQRARDAA